MVYTENHFQSLRDKAEQLLANGEGAKKNTIASDMGTLIHELEVHQIELEMQNEELRKAYKKLDETAAKYSDMYNYAPNGYFTVNRQGIIIDANITGLVMFKAEKENALEKRFETWLDDQHKDLFFVHLNRLFDHKDQKLENEFVVKRSDGSRFSAMIQGLVVDGEDQCRLMVMDITERKENEERQREVQSLSNEITERKRVEEELRCSQKELLQAKAELQNHNRELETIISFMSHDLRAPLVNIKGFANELKKACQDEHEILANVEIPKEIKSRLFEILETVVPEAIGFIQTSASFMTNVITSLVQVARAGLEVSKVEAIDMNEFISKIMKNTRTVIKKSHAEIIVRDLPGCVGDKNQLTHVFANVIGNAIKYLDPTRKGVITISGSENESESIYVIEDNGVGISPREVDKIFEMFYRLGDRKIGGEGIGLSIAKRMIEHNKGRIWVESEQGKGSKFCVALPKPDIGVSDQ